MSKHIYTQRKAPYIINGKDTRKQHGGARPNSGRPRGVLKKIKTVSLSDAQDERLKQIGGGSRTRGIQILLEKHADE